MRLNYANGTKTKKITSPIGEEGKFFNMDFHMFQSLLQTALQISTVVCEAEHNFIETQSEKERKTS